MSDELTGGEIVLGVGAAALVVIAWRNRAVVLPALAQALEESKQEQPPAQLMPGYTLKVKKCDKCGADCLGVCGRCNPGKPTEHTKRISSRAGISSRRARTGRGLLMLGPAPAAQLMPAPVEQVTELRTATTEKKKGRAEGSRNAETEKILKAYKNCRKAGESPKQAKASVVDELCPRTRNSEHFARSANRLVKKHLRE
jgi:hypothetical protein